ncbi:unnamed protein product [Rotaria sordida]|uniref:Uncharacterized protein n=1 Tax=Rotaria sordida TaxID=392033 RepID=A0A814G3C7_9BILA|nr:unnamed protein product [Rotaria sordida]CAF0978440.1 unnamed protein product [Rotaria sordida]CAF0992974.1 unnamed protein product [Rotaria sordida]CAF1067233.1 unnamed protein product [Rotaria sordida]CAF1121434.1 unnamed protein product [Rotaria sordida]
MNLKQESLKEYEDDSDVGGGGGGDFHRVSASSQFKDSRGPASTSHDLPTRKIILDNEEKPLTESSLSDLFSKVESKQMPTTIADHKVEEKKKKSIPAPPPMPLQGLIREQPKSPIELLLKKRRQNMQASTLLQQQRAVQKSTSEAMDLPFCHIGSRAPNSKI